ncbi:uncharacterized protein LOC132547700 [Ylistrum balloti]|uniref:uncharacterized protein LOC132547700 n=1 Tax=Ylistrum balloti TaxID=509963 RepID=UPI002905D8A1|nr:uncharacterized protein LOC132547700 [Ylistrum balloti]
MAQRLLRTQSILGVRRMLYRQHRCSKHFIEPIVTREFHITPTLGVSSGFSQTYATPEIKQMLVRMKFFKKVEHVPDFVGSGLVSLARDYFRVKMSMTIMNVLFFIIYLMFVWVRMQKAKKNKDTINLRYEANRSRELKKSEILRQDH